MSGALARRAATCCFPRGVRSGGRGMMWVARHQHGSRVRGRRAQSLLYCAIRFPRIGGGLNLVRRNRALRHTVLRRTTLREETQTMPLFTLRAKLLVGGI